MIKPTIIRPGPHHPITLEANPNHVIVRFAGRVIADSVKALVLREASYKPVLYIPRQDVALALLTISDLVTHCPYKGDATHFSITVGAATTENAAWSYQSPTADLSAIKDCIAFYPDRVDAIEEWEA